MNKIPARTLDFFDRHIINAMIDKYGFDELEAIKLFIGSETYQLLIDPELEFYKGSPYILFDMWEAEKITGNPRNSAYIRVN